VTSILTSISGQFGKGLILGAFFPVTAFVTLLLILGAPFVPAGLPVLKPLQDFDPAWRLITFSFVAVVLSGLLYNLNTTLIRFYEGYPWRSTWIGKRRIEMYTARLNGLLARRTGMRTLLRAMPSPPPDQPESDHDKILTRWGELSREAIGAFPIRPDLVLPTRLGNAIRSFEYYSERQYKMDAIVLWPRLIAKIDKEYAASVNDAKVTFDFMLNSSFLSILMALILLGLGVRYPLPLVNDYGWVGWLIAVVGFAVLAYVFYLAAIDAAVAWGEMVKGAFDLYRNSLMEQLGYKRSSGTHKDERGVWGEISIQMLLGDGPDGPRVEYVVPAPATPRTYARGAAGSPDLTVARGVTEVESDGTMTILLGATNASADESAKEVVIADTLPDGFEYVWDSAWSDGRTVTVNGTNPYSFEVGDLAPGAGVLLSYWAVPRPAGDATSDATSAKGG
jgi:hypothetical protein